MKKQKALQEFTEGLKKKHGNKIEKIIIFGSYARGEGGEDSDIDVFIIGDVSLDELVDISFPLLLKYGIHISPHVMTEEHFNLLDREGYGFIKNVKKEGSVIHA
ncbi:MAG: nucleotidyltransferase domain-containing protein [Candidatus Hydrothermarchaeaceae archaeon]